MSTYLDFGVKTRDNLKRWILHMLGAPLIRVELTEDQVDFCIDNAIELFSKYADMGSDHYAIDLEEYVEGVGVQLPSNVVAVHALEENDVSMGKGINTLFSVPNQLFNSGTTAIPGSSMFRQAGGWVTWDLSMQYIELLKKMTGGGFQFEYNPRTKYLKLTPDPKKAGHYGHIIVSCHILRPEEQMNGEFWVKRYALAECKILLGTIRSKFQGTQLLGGGSINAEIGSEGKEERDKLEEELRATEGGIYGFLVM
ncbi:MAG TPA: hypothetical protein PLA71_00715 [Saccharofermentans sp.]|nr:hypothetical protein [Saccharofermentans sp.]